MDLCKFYAHFHTESDEEGAGHVVSMGPTLEVEPEVELDNMDHVQDAVDLVTLKRPQEKDAVSEGPIFPEPIKDGSLNGLVEVLMAAQDYNVNIIADIQIVSVVISQVLWSPITLMYELKKFINLGPYQIQFVNKK
jgi:hypothetical protein